VTTRAERIANYTILIVFSLLALAPIVGLLLTALRPADSVGVGFVFPRSLHFHNFVDAWHTGDFGTGLRSSAIIAVAVVAIATVLSILGGYGLGTMRFRGDSVVFAAFLIGLIMPFEATIIPLYYDLRRVQLTGGYWGVILPSAALSVAFGTFWMRAFFLATPRSLLEAARIDGASSLRILVSVLLPFARPAVLTMMVLTFMWTWNDFLLSLVMLPDPSVQTAPLKLALFQGRYVTDITGLAAGALIVALPVIVVYAFLQRHFIRGVLSGAVKG
jgi:raffinose/stachyose/melibiose transport system permease protein